MKIVIPVGSGEAGTILARAFRRSKKAHRPSLTSALLKWTVLPN